MELDAIKQKKFEETQKQMMANPASSKKLLELNAAMSDAQIKGDTAAVRRLSREAEQIFAPTRADTLAALQKCGAAPQPHAAGVKIGTLNAELARVDAKIRDMDQKAMQQQAEDCKRPEASVAMCWERIEMFCGGQGAFSEKELAALNERKGALCAALKG
jgi:hypothetical protein